jgi:hypothetical protein
MPSGSKALLLKKSNLLLSDLNQALLRLDEALKQPENEFIRDAAIQRFEFCFELAWKAISPHLTTSFGSYINWVLCWNLTYAQNRPGPPA